MKCVQDSETYANSAKLPCTMNPGIGGSSEYFILSTDKRLDYFLSHLKLIFNQQNRQKIELGRRFT